MSSSISTFFSAALIVIQAQFVIAQSTNPPQGGLVLWLDAAQTSATSKQGLRVWENRAPSESRGAGQPDTDRQPTRGEIDGHPIASFDGIDDFLHLPWLKLDRDFSLFILTTREPQTEGGSMWRAIFSGDGDAFQEGQVGQYTLFTPNGSRPRIYLGESPRRDTEQSPLRVNGPPLLPVASRFDLVHLEVRAGRYDELRLSVNGELMKTRHLSPEDRETVEYEAGYLLGQGGNFRAGSQSRHYRGGIGEVLVYERGLTNRETALVEQHLAERYDLKLPSRPPLATLDLWLDPSRQPAPEAEHEVTEIAARPVATIRNEGKLGSKNLQIRNFDPITQPKHKPERFDGSDAYRFVKGEGLRFEWSDPKPSGTLLYAATNRDGKFRIAEGWPTITLSDAQFEGDLHELLSYSETLSPEEKEEAKAYLAARHAPSLDPRRFENGDFLFTNGYIDQPYTVVCGDGSWLTVMTSSNFSESTGDFFLLTTRSHDEGKTWSRPVAVIEPPTLHRASWATLMRAPDDRIFCFYNLKESRVDVRGRRKFCYRWSDDHGATWSDARGEIPLDRLAHEGERITPNGWSVCPPFHRDGSTYLTHTRFVPPGRSEGRGHLHRSPDLLTSAKPETASWERLPDDAGLRNDEIPSSFQEEHIVVPLEKKGHLYTIWRTADGYALESYSRDDGETWTAGAPVTFTGTTSLLRQPLACILPTRLADGSFLLWFHNASPVPGGKPFLPRDMAWASLGKERDGRLHWSQPEIITYGHDMPIGGLGMSYPGVIEHEEGVSFLTTDKMTARRILFPKEKIEGLRDQLDGKKRAANLTTLEKGGTVAIGEDGFTIDLRLPDEPTSSEGLLVELRAVDERPALISIHGKQDSIVIALHDHRGRIARHPITVLRDESRRLTILVDLRAGIVFPLLDGTQAEPAGGTGSSYLRLREDFRIRGSLRTAELSDDVIATWTDRALTTSEAILHQRAD